MATKEWKMPPLIKLYEALGALGDGRVKITGEELALVTSSDGGKTYEVRKTADGREVSSNDNASYWQGYLGYPAIAALVRWGVIEPPATEAERALAGIHWKDLNRNFKNDYAKTLAEVDSELVRRGHDPASVRAAALGLLRSLERLRLTRGKRARPPSR